MYPALEPPERGVAHVRPLGVVARIRIGGTGCYFRKVSDPHRLAIPRCLPDDCAVRGAGVFAEKLGATAVVREEQHECVPFDSPGFECVENLADTLVHPVDLGCVDRHSHGLPRPVFGIVPVGN